MEHAEGGEAVGVDVLALCGLLVQRRVAGIEAALGLALGLGFGLGLV